MLVIISFYRFLYFMKTRKLPSFFLAFAYIAAACMMHSGVIALALIYIVCIPLYNGEKTVRAAVESAVNGAADRRK